MSATGDQGCATAAPGGHVGPHTPSSGAGAAGAGTDAGAGAGASLGAGARTHVDTSSDVGLEAAVAKAVAARAGDQSQPVVTYHASEVLAEDVPLTADGQWLNDRVIAFYGECVPADRACGTQRHARPVNAGCGALTMVPRCYQVHCP